MRAIAAIKRYFLAGVVVVMPLFVTLYIIWIVAGILFQFVDPVVAEADLGQYVANVRLIARIMAAVLIILALSIIGYVARTSSGRWLFGGIDRTIAYVPLAGTVYSTARQIATRLTIEESSYESLVLVEFPRKGVYAIGFITSDSPRAVEKVAGEEVYNVFLPSSPNPTGGRLLLVPESEIVEVDLSTRDGLRLLMTTGMGRDEEVEIPPDLAAKLPEDSEEEDFDEGDSEEGDSEARESDETSSSRGELPDSE